MDAKSSEREKQICERLRQFRESLQIPRTRFALSIGVTEAALAGYELGRARLRYETFAAVQKRFSINPVWLATGDKNLLLYNWNDEKFRAQVKPREIFSQAYERLIASHLYGDRFNMDGTLANANLAKDWFAALPRFRAARKAAGVSLKDLARRLDSKNSSLGTPKELKVIEDGKKYPGGRGVAHLVHELRNPRGLALEGGRGDVPFYGPTARAFPGHHRRPGFSSTYYCQCPRVYGDSFFEFGGAGRGLDRVPRKRPR